jgi:hypothetical protein
MRGRAAQQKKILWYRHTSELASFNGVRRRAPPRVTC